MTKITLLQGHVLPVLQSLPDESVQCVRRQPKLYWKEDWLFNEYAIKGRSASDIAKGFGCQENNILFFLSKFNIPRRTVSEARKIKKWAMCGKQNGMFGKSGKANPNWKGGITGDRQLFYLSKEWKVAVRKVWKRDKALCQRCRLRAFRKAYKEFHIHHIVSFSVIELRTEISNLILLCNSCHSFVHSKANIGREFIKEVMPNGKGDVNAGPHDRQIAGTSH